MAAPQAVPAHCNDNVWFYKCSEFLGCSTHKLEYEEKSKFSYNYPSNDIPHRDSNETICDFKAPANLSCCPVHIDWCLDSCPTENFNSSILSHILTSFPASTIPSGSSIRPSSISSSRGLVTSTTPTSDYSSVSSEAVNGQTTLSTVPTVSKSASTSPNAATSPESTSTSPNAAAVGESTSSSPNAAAIAGGVAGGFAGLALLVGLLAICRRRRKIKSQRGIDKGRFSAWNSGQPRSMQPGSAELDEIKQGPSTTSSPLPPPSAPPSPLLSPLPPPPAYASYNPHGNGLEGSPDHLHPSSGSPYVSYDVPAPESPPSPPPLKTRLSQQSTGSYSDGQDVSPISTHYQTQPFDNPRSLRSSVYSDVSGGVLHAHAM